MPSDYSLVLCNSLGNICIIWLGHNTNSSIGSVLVKVKFVDMSALLVITQPTYIVCNTGITVWLGLISISISVAKGLS